MHELKQEIAKSTGPAVCDRGVQPSCLSMMLPGVAGWCHMYIYIYDLPTELMALRGSFRWYSWWWRCKTESYKTCAQVNPVVPVVGLDEFRQHCQLVEQLLLRRCAEFYEGKGIPARRLGSLKAAANLAKDPCRATIGFHWGSKRYVIEVFSPPCVLDTNLLKLSISGPAGARRLGSPGE